MINSFTGQKAAISGCCLVLLSSMCGANEHLEQTDLFSLSLEELLQVEIASMFEESNLSAPASVSVYHERDWINRSARRADEIAGYQPGVVVHPTISGANAFVVRGYSRPLSVRGIATQLDGVPLNNFSYGTAQYFLSNFDIGALERVELIRGPGSALYGSDAFHGVYSLNTFAPQQDQTNARLTLGTPEFVQGSVRTSQQLESGGRIHATVAASGEGDSDVAYPDGDNPGAFGSREDQYESFTGVLKYQQPFSGQRNLELGFYYNQSDADNYIGPGISPSGSGLDNFGPDNLSGGNHYFAMLRGVYSQPLTDDTRLEFKGYHWEAENTFDFRIQSNPFLKSKDQRSGLSAIVKHNHHATDPGVRDQWLLGLEASQQKIQSATNISGEQPMSGLHREIYSLLGQYRVFIWQEHLSVMLGGRYDNYVSFEDHFSPRAALVFQPQQNTAYKLLYGHAFRAPFGSELTESGAILGSSDLSPEEIDTYELVYMCDFEHSQFQASVFFSDYSNAIIAQSATLPAPYTLQYANAGDYSARGIELEYRIVRRPWTFDSSLSYVESEDETMNIDFVSFPDYILRLDMGYAPEGSRHSVFMSNQAYFGMQANTNNASGDLAPYWMTNLHYAYAMTKQSEVQLDIRNLFDREDRMAALWNDPNGYPTDGINFAVSYNKTW